MTDYVEQEKKQEAVSEADSLREIIKKQDLIIKKLKFYAWSFSEALDRNDVESEDVLSLRNELQQI